MKNRIAALMRANDMSDDRWPGLDLPVRAERYDPYTPLGDEEPCRVGDMFGWKVASANGMPVADNLTRAVAEQITTAWNSMLIARGVLTRGEVVAWTDPEPTK